MVVSEPTPHLTEHQVAAYLEGATTGDVRAVIEEHLVACAACRDELVAARQLASTVLGRPWSPSRVWIAAAAAVLLFAVLRPIPEEPERHRESPVMSVIAPVAIAPAGVIRGESNPAFLWTSVPNADRYIVRVFSGDGAVLWLQQTSDTTMQFPDSLRRVLRREVTHYWRVEAQIGFDRGASSELIEFTPHTAGRQ